MGVQFHPANFKVCHKCLDIVLYQKEEDFFCTSKEVKADPTAKPYAYQQLILHCNYSATVELYSKKKSQNQ